VLVFALANGLFWVGAAATLIMGVGTALTVAAIATVAVAARNWAGRFTERRDGCGSLMLRGIEVAAAFLVAAFGVLLLFGYMGSERLIGM
jgi:nickel/cobalt transporter (NicO) family protein